MIVTWLTDLHVHNFKKFDVNGSRLRNTLNVLERVFSFSNKNRIKHVLFSGDLFDQQKVLPAVVINEVTSMFRQLFNEYPDIKFVAITGNHDQATINLDSKSAVSALQYLATSFEDNFILIDNDVYTLSDGTVLCGIPYYEHSEHFRMALERMNEKMENYSGSKILLIHQTPSGLKGRYSMIPVDIEHDSDLFNPYTLVLCGHIHVKHELGKVLVGGSPIQKDFSDAGDDKGYWAIDTATGDYRFRSLNKFYPKFVRVREGNVPDADESDYVEVVPAVKSVDSEEQEHVEMYKTDNTPKELLTNFWQEVEGKDEELLKVGLSFL